MLANEDLLALMSYDDKWQLAYHQMPVSGWMNDPNGSIQVDGTYHLYYQYQPNSANGGATHWGHKTSTDLVHFCDEPIFLSPDQAFDRDGVYSGSAIQVGDDIHYFYTGNVKEAGFHDYTFSGRQQNVIHVVSPDGYQINQREVVIPHKDFPDEFTDHIRDPKLFQHEDYFYMILGGRLRTNKGAILLYRSTNLSDWTYRGYFLSGDDDQGYMWECPDTFTVDGQDVLMFSPQGVIGDRYHFQNTHNAGYLLGQFDWEKEQFDVQSPFYELDQGFDFYAPQSFVDEQGRRIMWAWFGLPDISPEYSNPTVAYGWQHAMTLPRQLFYEEGQLKQRVVSDYQKLRAHHQQILACKDSQGKLAGQVYELEIKGENIRDLSLDLRQDTKISYHADSQEFVLAHGPSGCGRRKRCLKLKQLDHLHIYSDWSSLEIFINDGQQVMSTRVYPDKGQDTIHLQTDSPCDIDLWDLKSSKGDK
ncbi:glycoside hydrolase family 32 protein [Aerococcus kribbianus]|uniref:Sucrose-6-phosphate hydrolase n=1 Tax=Aerococcus kribbianus TaxID=2999064 RepID=A0A9X3FN94_9LACT|nr:MULTISPECIES: glycoside hydrolase family 32 protein [unclassified Aerococcus]MCZ0716888.1 glycoside hydrolase family 32 protein [Aerococcus sp. YH-aer221]MCZ0725176.1 glycoside hydrolase family 32 protein [Aerococcus sp. YH-aer222]